VCCAHAHRLPQRPVRAGKIKLGFGGQKVKEGYGQTQCANAPKLLSASCDLRIWQNYWA
jgi:hypothetical protein